MLPRNFVIDVQKTFYIGQDLFLISSFVEDKFNSRCYLCLNYTVVLIILLRMHLLICLGCILINILIFIHFVIEIESIITESKIFKLKLNLSEQELRFLILKIEVIWLRFRFIRKSNRTVSCFFLINSDITLIVMRTELTRHVRQDHPSLIILF